MVCGITGCRECGMTSNDSTMSDEKELLPCPMCGGNADYNWDEIGEEKIRQWYIHCAPDDSFKGCIAHDGRFATLKEAVQHWNTRINPHTLATEEALEALRFYAGREQMPKLKRYGVTKATLAIASLTK